MWHELFDLPAYSSDKIFDTWTFPPRLKQIGCGVSSGLFSRLFGGDTVERFRQQFDSMVDMIVVHLMSF